MKRRFIMCALLAAAVIGVHGVRAVSAGGQKTVEVWGWGAPDMMPLLPEDMADHMAWRLKLTSNQKAKIEALFSADRGKTAPLMQKMSEYRKQLYDAVHAATFDETAIRALAAKQAQAEIEVIVSRARMQNRVSALLTPEQRALAEKFPPPFRRVPGPGRWCGCGHGHVPGDDWEKGEGPDSGEEWGDDLP